MMNLEEIDKQIADLQEKRIAAVKEQRTALLKALKDLDSSKSVKLDRREKVAPVYVNLSDVNQTWCGRGKRPAWVVSAINAGITLSDMKINKA
jgi:DNA-binding protein H-NS